MSYRERKRELQLEVTEFQTSLLIDHDCHYLTQKQKFLKVVTLVNISLSKDKV